MVSHHLPQNVGETPRNGGHLFRHRSERQLGYWESNVLNNGSASTGEPDLSTSKSWIIG
jgi:hypothetical protein